MLKKFNNTKNYPFFLLQAPTHHSFTFNSQFLYELKHMVHLSKNVCACMCVHACMHACIYMCVCVCVCVCVRVCV